MDYPLISVIIPVYNVEGFLQQCLESIVQQTYFNWEVVLINDGSPDESGEICKEWAKRDQRFRYYTQENKGLGPTRNRGVLLAAGEYVVFIDSDDWVEKTFLQALYDKLVKEKVDFCRCRFEHFDNQKKGSLFIMETRRKSSRDIESYTSPHMQGNLFKKEMLLKENITMPAIPFEDLATFPIILMLGYRQTCAEKALYHYRTNINSIMNNPLNIERYIEALEYLCKETEERGIYKQNEMLLWAICIKHMRSGLHRLKGAVSQNEYDKVKDKFEQYLKARFRKDNGKIWTWGSYNLERIYRQMELVGNNLVDESSSHYEFSSIISLMAQPDERIESLQHKNVFRNIMLHRDWNKKFIHCDIESRDYLLLDFLEERYPVLRTENGAIITKSEAWDEIECPDIKNKYSIIERNSVEGKKLWEESCLQFIDWLHSNFMPGHVILVETKLCSQFGTEDIQKNYWTSVLTEVNRVNLLLDFYYDFFKKHYKECQVIRIPSEYNYTDIDFVYGCRPWYFSEEGCQKLPQVFWECIRQPVTTKVSVIMPVYNVEKYLNESISSVIHQRIEDIELICIDDASTDGSLNILKKFEEQDKRVIVLTHPYNKGQSAARNTGLEVAKGEFIYFLDADDMITEHALEHLYEIAVTQETDDIFFDVETIYEGDYLKETSNFASSRHWHGNYPDVYKGIQLLEIFQQKDDWVCSVPRQFYRHDFLKNYKLNFYEGIVHEDELFTTQVLIMADRVKCIDEKFFVRRVRCGSTMTSKYSWKNFAGYFTVWYELLELYKKHEFSFADNEIIKERIQTLGVGLKGRYYRLIHDGEVTNGELCDKNQQVLFAMLRTFWKGERRYILTISADIEHRWRQSELVYIYGAGTVAKEILEYANERQLNIDGFIVTNKEMNPQAIMGHRIYGIDDLKHVRNNCLVIIGVAKSNEKSVRRQLCDKEFKHVISVL